MKNKIEEKNTNDYGFAADVEIKLTLKVDDDNPEKSTVEKVVEIPSTHISDAAKMLAFEIEQLKRYLLEKYSDDVKIVCLRGTEMLQ